ncbi:universal stress protein [Stutzerimonas tarimensis]|uniref:Universal stress protein n=1 Tax=Stutzerimonas tarimensis TaxID=1507735 RepID=A0ABV7T5Y3_9GAMM
MFIHNLLAASDLSSLSRHAAERAALIACRLDVPLSIQHVVSHGALESLRHLLERHPEDYRQRLLDEAREELEKLAAGLVARHGAKIGLQLSQGQVVDEIAGYADALDAGLLVMGAHGEGQLSERFYGSTLERVLRGASRPLLAVKHAPAVEYRRVLVPIDFSDRSLHAVRMVQAIAPQAQLSLLHAYQLPFEGKLFQLGVGEAMHAEMLDALHEEARQRMDRLMSEADLDRTATSCSLFHGDPVRHVLEQQQTQDCDLIVMGKRGVGRLESWLVGSVTRHILAQAACDTLIVDVPPA